MPLTVNTGHASHVDPRPQEAEHSPRHRWFFLKEAFAPSVVHAAIADSQCSTADLAIDPFCGSGTTPLAANLRSVSALGFEVNPFLAFVARAKLVQCRPSALSRDAVVVIDAMKRGRRSPLEGFSTFTAKPGAEKWLFNTSVIRAFEAGWQKTEEVGRQTSKLIRLSLIAAAMDCCNAVQDGKCLRYRPERQRRDFESSDLRDAFQRRIDSMEADLLTTALADVPCQIVACDSRSLPLKRQFRVCVTSPPYLNSFDYSDIYRPELFLGRFVADMPSLVRLRLRTLRSHLQVDWKSPVGADFGSHYDKTQLELGRRRDTLWDYRIPRMVHAYFEDLRIIVRRLRRYTFDHSSLWIVVSNSAYAGVEIPVDLILADIASRAGWSLRRLDVLRYLNRVSAQQWHTLKRKARARPVLRETLLVFDATPRRAVV